MSNVINTNTTFDLFEYIRTIHNVDVAAAICQAVAWRIDTLLQSNARQLFKNVREDLFKKGVDGLAELSMALNEQAFAEHAFEQTGSNTLGPVTAIKELVIHREGAHALTANLTAMTFDWQGQPRHYEIPDLDDVFFKKVELKVKGQTKRRIAMSVERRAKAYALSTEDTQSLVDKRIQREEDRLNDISETVQDQAAAVHEMFRLAVVAPEQTKVGKEFHTMDISLQRTLIDAARMAADRYEEQATSDNRLSDNEFDSICIAVMAVNKDLKRVLDSSRFRTAETQERAIEAAVG